MNWYSRLIINLEYLCNILIHHYPRACWNHYIRAHLWSKFNWLVGRSGSIFCRYIWDLWSVYNTNSCIEVPQDSKKMLVTYWTRVIHSKNHLNLMFFQVFLCSKGSLYRLYPIEVFSREILRTQNVIPAQSTFLFRLYYSYFTFSLVCQEPFYPIFQFSQKVSQLFL